MAAVVPRGHPPRISQTCARQRANRHPCRLRGRGVGRTFQESTKASAATFRRPTTTIESRKGITYERISQVTGLRRGRMMRVHLGTAPLLAAAAAAATFG